MTVFVNILAAAMDHAVGETTLPRVRSYGTWCPRVCSKSPYCH